MLTADTLLVADSFRVRADPGSDCGGLEVQQLDAHLERFRNGVHEVLEGARAFPDDADGDRAHDDWFALELEPFLTAAPAEIADGGAGFPRLELWERPDGALALRVQLRATPPLQHRIALRSTPSPALTSPTVKGPNIARFAELNRVLGAEALLLDAEGSIVEGATTSVLWWRNGILHSVRTRARVDSITEGTVLAIAAHAGIPCETGQATPADLTECEVWTVNALHGIRPARTLDGAPLPPPSRTRLARFRAALEEVWAPLDDSPEHARGGFGDV